MVDCGWGGRELALSPERVGWLATGATRQSRPGGLEGKQLVSLQLVGAVGLFGIFAGNAFARLRWLCLLAFFNGVFDDACTYSGVSCQRTQECSPGAAAQVMIACCGGAGGRRSWQVIGLPGKIS